VILRQTLKQSGGFFDNVGIIAALRATAELKALGSLKPLVPPNRISISV
jgi:hypothetical protein